MATFNKHYGNIEQHLNNKFNIMATLNIYGNKQTLWQHLTNIIAQHSTNIMATLNNKHYGKLWHLTNIMVTLNKHYGNI